MSDPLEIERRLAQARRELRQRILLGFTPPRFRAPEWQPRMGRLYGWLFPRDGRFVPVGSDDLQVSPLLLRASGSRSHSNESGPGAFVPTRWGTSRNWSGAVLAATDGELFETVTASWVVPEPFLPDGERVDGREPGHGWQSSAWIGLDGYRAFSRGLPQIGTASVVDIAADPNDASRRIAVPHCYAWVQWWVRGKHFGEVRVNAQKFPVAAGDHITARVQVLGSRDGAWFQMTRRPAAGGAPVTMEVLWAAGRVTQKVLQDTETLLEESKTPGSVDRSLALAEGLHAVFCVERPLSLPAPGRPPALYPLPRIGDLPFETAFAASRRPGANEGREHDLRVARLVRMVGREDGATRTRHLAEPWPIVRRESMFVRQR
jgi:hypothetical protein